MQGCPPSHPLPWASADSELDSTATESLWQLGVCVVRNGGLASTHNSLLHRAFYRLFHCTNARAVDLCHKSARRRLPSWCAPARGARARTDPTRRRRPWQPSPSADRRRPSVRLSRGGLPARPTPEVRGADWVFGTLQLSTQPHPAAACSRRHPWSTRGRDVFQIRMSFVFVHPVFERSCVRADNTAAALMCGAPSLLRSRVGRSVLRFSPCLAVCEIRRPAPPPISRRRASDIDGLPIAQAVSEGTMLAFGNACTVCACGCRRPQYARKTRAVVCRHKRPPGYRMCSAGQIARKSDSTQTW
ncbi:hypothetical protein BD413DRAFT_49285 [Trametes elegans]|nr:hypothetical protein BD413DRAFT_49285 [Trametes elegans]